MADDAALHPILLDRYLAGELTAAERLDVESWLQRHPELAALVREAPAAVLGQASRANTDAAWQRLAARVGGAPVDELAARRERRPARVVPQRVHWLRRAAAVAALLCIVAGGVATWRTVGGGVITAPQGKNVATRLPDGTRLTLSAGSRVTWSASFGKTARDVTLDGEGFFDVVHDETRPFRVHSRDAVAQDVGTRFVVRAWPEMQGVEVAVEEGLVELADSLQQRRAEATLLRPGQRGVLQHGAVVVTTDAEATLAWTRGALIFADRPLSEVLPALSRRFDVSVTADPMLTSRRFTARFPNPTLEQVLDAIAVTLDVRVVSRGRDITLTPSIK